MYAGFGVSGSLLAAIGAAFVVGGGIMAFDTWPTLAGPAPERALEVRSAPLPAAAAATPVSLPAAVAAPLPAAATRPAAGAPARRGELREQLGATDQRPAPQPNVVTPAPAPAGDPVLPDATPSPLPVSPLADVVEGTTGGVATTVRSVGTALPVAAPVTDAVAGTVDGAGRAVGGVVRVLADR